MQDLKGKTLEEIKQLCNELGLPLFKSKEIFRFLHSKMKDGIDDFTFLSIEERNNLKASFYIAKVAPVKTEKEKGVQKVAFRLDDGEIIETVLMEYERGRKTLCISSQSGCPVGCKFCATGQMGFRRNLTAGEILSQVYFFASSAGALAKAEKNDRISNIVFMGMGEPFYNYNNVMEAVKTLNHPLGQNISARKIVLSTIGVVAGIQKLAREPEQFRLAWSLVAPSDLLRKKLIPLKGLDSLQNVLDALRDYQNRTNRRITIEYVVLAGVNDREEEIDQLIEIAKQLDSHVNLIPYNATSRSDFANGNVVALFHALQRAEVNVTIRKSLGQEISAACGQLSSKLK
ncbi:MAG: 23S rRNA (adenine(2503)-C(2))-methyltransferase RlmN [Candidatus Saganbacteria bacterium]|nr:23S rRNA (adenine(2503)-C(2))-methyltransferase RlmN [Candidatus Saganbacteria bacterium]